MIQGGKLRWKTHQSIGIAAYTACVTLLYPTKTLDFNLWLMTMSPITYVSSILPDKLDDYFALPHRGISHTLVCSLSLSGFVCFLTFGLRGWSGGIIPFPLFAPLIAFFIVLGGTCRSAKVPGTYAERQ